MHSSEPPEVTLSTIKPQITKAYHHVKNS